MQGGLEEKNMKQRETFQSRLGFLLLSAGCAIGIGNVWRFPYVVGANGGGIFVVIYLLFLAIMGVPVLSMEFAVGRASRKSPVKAYQELERRGVICSVAGTGSVIAGGDSAGETLRIRSLEKIRDALESGRRAGVSRAQALETVEYVYKEANV